MFYQYLKVKKGWNTIYLNNKIVNDNGSCYYIEIYKREDTLYYLDENLIKNDMKFCPFIFKVYDNETKKLLYKYSTPYYDCFEFKDNVALHFDGMFERHNFMITKKKGNRIDIKYLIILIMIRISTILFMSQVFMNLKNDKVLSLIFLILWISFEIIGQKTLQRHENLTQKIEQEYLDGV